MVYFRLPFWSRLPRLGGSPKMPLLTGLPSNEQGRGGTVIGPLTAVFFDAATELRPGHDDDVIGFAVRGEVAVKGGEAVGKSGHQSVVGGLLIGVGIEAAERDIAHAQPQVLHDGLRQNFEPGGEWPVGIGHSRTIGSIGLAQLARTILRAQSGSIEQGRVGGRFRDRNCRDSSAPASAHCRHRYRRDRAQWHTI